MYETGEGATISQDTAIKWFKEGAKLNSKSALNELARHYYFGYGVD